MQTRRLSAAEFAQFIIIVACAVWYTAVMQTGRWREQWAGTVHNPDDLVRFVDAVGCCTIDALPGVPDFPSQSAAMGTIDAGAPDLWFWKDDLHIEKRLYYSRVFGRRPGYVSQALLPALIATNGAVADELILTGAMPATAQQLYHLIEEHGPIATRQMKRLLAPATTDGADSALQFL